ncbi:hypothetical protein NDU88_012734 [Pleurodeles waltl]|uniref:Uncharacterized protein n=1 Tax=Pleurodeles waltl TaxID=8319 RepID=A0AAV7R1L3_PLEWA|nr:hypothetical protein NDU88_012734 [Pleurodeles waltl]
MTVTVSLPGAHARAPSWDGRILETYRSSNENATSLKIHVAAILRTKNPASQIWSLRSVTAVCIFINYLTNPERGLHRKPQESPYQAVEPKTSLFFVIDAELQPIGAKPRVLSNHGAVGGGDWATVEGGRFLSPPPGGGFEREGSGSGGRSRG